MLFALLLLPACGGRNGVGDGTSAADTQPPSNADENAAEPPKRVAVLFSSMAEMWLEAGGEIAITVGETVERGFADESVELVDDGAGKTVNIELLLSLEPDLVICSGDIPAQVDAAKICRKAGIDTLILSVECFDDYLEAMDRMTSLTGVRDGYAAALEMKKQIDAIVASEELSALKNPKILFIRTGSTNSSTKPKQASDHFACAMLEELGCVNIISDAPILLDGLNMEAIVAIDPDYIFFSLMGDETAARKHIDELLSEAAWQSLSAVREGRVHILPKELFHFKPNSRWGEAYKYLSELLTAQPG